MATFYINGAEVTVAKKQKLLRYLREESLPELVAEYDIDMALFLYHQNNLSEELIDFLNRGE